MSGGINPALSLALDEIMAELRGAGKEVDFIPVAEGLVARGFSHMTMGQLRAVLREKIKLLQGSSDE